MITGGIRACTEARTSIRESLRIFRILQESPHNFEQLCFAYSTKSINSNTFQFASPNDASCGNFIKCFTALFLRKKDINRHILNSVIDGSAIQQYWNHSNLVMHSILLELSLMPEKWKWGILSGNADRISKYQARSSLNSLSDQLLITDDKENLPRVFLMSMSWVFVEKVNGTSKLKSHDKPIGDHKFAVIKHDNDCFQMIQNYICDLTLQNPRPSLSLRDWQASGNPFSPAVGFSKAQMVLFLGHLGGFASDNKFSSVTHEAMFGVHVENGEGYWPSFSFRELDDDCIRGFGSRCMANELLIDCAVPNPSKFVMPGLSKTVLYEK